jgi:hypothetical protein
MEKENLIQRIARELPTGWRITITVEKGSASVELRSPYRKIISPDFRGYTLGEQIEELILMAKKRDEELSKNRRRYE